MKRACAVALILIAAGCSDSPEVTEPPTSPVTAPAPAEAPTPSMPQTTPESSESPSPTPEATPMDAGAATTTDPDSSEAPSVIIVGEGEDKNLVLSEAKNEGTWKEGDRQVAGKGERKQAMFTEVTCYDSDLEVVEYRFADTKGRISVGIAQDMDSDSSDRSLEFQLIADGRLVDTKTIKFSEQKELTAPLTGVTALKIGVKSVEEESCKDSTTALITGVSVKG